MPIRILNRPLRVKRSERKRQELNRHLEGVEPMTHTQYPDETAAQAVREADPSFAPSEANEIAPVAQIARCPSPHTKMSGPTFQLTDRLAPAADALLSLIEDDTLPDRAVEPLGTALLILAEVAEDDELGLIGAAPETRIAISPPGALEDTCPADIFDEALFTPYVRAIYIREIEAVRLAPPDAQEKQLSISAHTLARIIAASALPGAHVRKSLECAASLPEATTADIIADAFSRGLINPRKLPGRKAWP